MVTDAVACLATFYTAVMKVRFFCLDEDDRLQKVAQRHVEKAWWDERPWDDSTGRGLVRLVTVVLDGDHRLRGCFLLRLTLKDGRLTHQVRREILATAQSGMEHLGKRSKPTGHPLIEKQMEGWPATLKRQLAVALDVPIGQLPTPGFGGPLVTAARLRISVKRALDYFQEPVGET